MYIHDYANRANFISPWVQLLLVGSLGLSRHRKGMPPIGLDYPCDIIFKMAAREL